MLKQKKKKHNFFKFAMPLRKRHTVFHMLLPFINQCAQDDIHFIT